MNRPFSSGFGAPGIRSFLRDTRLGHFLPDPQERKGLENRLKFKDLTNPAAPANVKFSPLGTRPKKAKFHRRGGGFGNPQIQFELRNGPKPISL